MKSFALDENGDLLIENNEIVMVNGAELTRQKVKTVLSTNKGEWSLNVDEGITFANILGKSRMLDPSSENANTSAQLESVKRKDDALNKLLERRLDGEG